LEGKLDHAEYDQLGPDFRWALDRVREFEYRREFGLTHEEFLREPLDVLVANMTIMSERNKIEKAQQRMAEHGIKR
jgi:hypothetical protein